MTKINHFSIYHINFEKVFEIAMLMDNHAVTSFDENVGHDHKMKIGSKIKATLATIFSAEVDGSYEFTGTNSTKKTIEIKYTNAIFLKSIMDGITGYQRELDDCTEGQLIIQDVNLNIRNEEEMRQMKLIKRGLLDKFIHEDMSMGELMKTISEDYNYLLTSNQFNKKVLIKIPSKLENEFENNYTIDDILNGSTTIIGVYRGLRKLEDFKSTFQYLTSVGSKNDVEEDNAGDEIIESSTECPQEANPLEEDNDNYHYIDVLAIIQKIEL